ncbi:hypothetical protein THIX_20076 [Thiomonas sp. X19]|nr:hypothetical protein THIX_20076 [Thiomonas sp. X19]
MELFMESPRCAGQGYVVRVSVWRVPNDAKSYTKTKQNSFPAILTRRRPCAAFLAGYRRGAGIA